MPNLFDYLGYRIYFWSNENFEPIHVHISKGNPNTNSTKVWLTKNGGTVVADNDARIPEKDLKRLLNSIEANFFYIVFKWKEYFGEEEIKFYC